MKWARNSDIKVAILTGNGKSFCSGIDLSVIGKDNLLDPRGDGKTCRMSLLPAINPS